MNRVYLAGSMGGLSYDEANTWRIKANKMLAAAGIASYSPMRAKDHLKGTELVIGPTGGHPFSMSKGIMARDLNDTLKADALLVYFPDGCGRSLGTAMELMAAYIHHIPVVAIVSEDNENYKHAMMQEAIKFRVDTIEEGVELIRSILLPETFDEDVA